MRRDHVESTLIRRQFNVVCPLGYMFVMCQKINITHLTQIVVILTYLSGRAQAHSLYNRLSLSRIPRECLKYFDISVPRHISTAELRKK